MPMTIVDIVDGKVTINGKEVTNLADLQQQATELKNHPMFELLLLHAKSKAYKQGFLEAQTWDATLSGKGWQGCVVNMENVLDGIIGAKGDVV